MPITSTALTPRTQSLPTNAIPQGQAPVIADGVPSNVKPVAGQPDQVAFTMKGDKGQVDLVWDKAKNELFVKDKDGTLSKASLVEQRALMDRLSGRDFAPIRKGSAYDLMRQDIMEATSKEPRLPTKPQLPETPKDAISTEDLYADTPTETKPTETKPTETKPTETKPTETKPTQETKPTETKPTETPVDPTLKEADFLAKNGARSVTTEALRARGLDVRGADLDGNGAISGTEWKGVWKAIDRADKNGDARSVDTRNAAVKRGLDAVDGAANGKAPYGANEKKQIDFMLQNGPVEAFRELTAAECQQKGLPRGTMMAKFNDGFGSGAGGGGRQDVHVYATPNGALFKEYINAEDGKNTPVVKLTDREHRLIYSRGDLSVEANTDREIRARNRIFGSEEGLV
jgi:hypothetical protein